MRSTSSSDRRPLSIRMAPMDRSASPAALRRSHRGHVSPPSFKVSCGELAAAGRGWRPSAGRGADRARPWWTARPAPARRLRCIRSAVAAHAPVEQLPGDGRDRYRAAGRDQRAASMFFGMFGLEGSSGSVAGLSTRAPAWSACDSRATPGCAAGHGVVGALGGFEVRSSTAPSSRCDAHVEHGAFLGFDQAAQLGDLLRRSTRLTLAVPPRRGAFRS